VLGMTVAVIGWLYLLGGLSGGCQVMAATVVDRMLFVPTELTPTVLVPNVLAGVFPHVLMTFAILDPLSALGAWLLLRRCDIRSANTIPG
jgi:hypothetical protein